MTWLSYAQKIMKSAVRSAIQFVTRATELARGTIALAWPSLGTVRIASVTQDASGERQVMINAVAAVVVPAASVALLAVLLAALQHVLLWHALLAGGALVATVVTWDSRPAEPSLPALPVGSGRVTGPRRTPAGRTPSHTG